MMPDRHEVMNERLYLKEPRTDRLRKRSAARLRHLLSTGWRETERWHTEEYVTVRVERTGVSPSLGKMPRSNPSEDARRREGNRPSTGFRR